jgi:ADP-dependent NAD(P)H-hydrate dehydratase
MSPSRLADVRVVDADIWRVPPTAERSKHDRGRVLVVGGSRETPGAVLLAAEAALRVGVGLVQIATAESAASGLALALPEARVVPLPEVGASGAVVDGGRIADLAAGVDAVLVGSGTFDRPATRSLLAAALDGLGDDGVVVVDAAALDVVAEEPELLDGVASRAVLMPNLGEAARLLDDTVDRVRADTPAAVDVLVQRFRAAVAVRGEESWIGAPGRPLSCHRGGQPLLGVAGSGDVLAGVLVGLAARGCAPLAAAECAVLAHARAGECLAATGPGVGRLARELVEQLPAVVEGLDRKRASRS